MPYEDIHHEAFRDLNMEWLVKYNLAEELDLCVLANPSEEILRPGGFIWIAVDNGVVIGTAALVKSGHHEYELAKMSVAVPYRGKGIGRKLIETCLERARQIGAEKVTLYSNHQLGAALKLYETLGFHYVPVVDSPFVTADIKMELTFAH